MARWEPGAVDRLRAAALDLFATKGYEQTTAAEIAEAAGLTQRTFFRYFADKREVIFHGQDEFVAQFVAGLDDAAPGAAPLDRVEAALARASVFFSDERRPHSVLRQSIIAAHPALQERERHKLAGLAVEVAEHLRATGVGEPAATLAAETGSMIFGLAFAQWLRDGETRSLTVIAADLLAELRALRTTG